MRKRAGIGNGESAIDRRTALSTPGGPRGVNGAADPQLPVPESHALPHADARPVVRRAASADLPNIVSLRMALLREHAHNPIYSRLRADADARAAKLFAAQLQSPNEVIFLAELGGDCVGILRCIQSSGSPLLDPAQYAYVSSVYVIPAARERGVLRSLLAAAEAWCTDRGLEEMRLHNAADNPLANAAWEALGFEVVEHLRVRSLRR